MKIIAKSVNLNSIFRPNLKPGKTWGNSSFGAYVPFKNLAFEIPSPSWNFQQLLSFFFSPWHRHEIISGTGHWQTYQLSYYFLFFLSAIQSHRLLKDWKCQAWSLMSLKIHPKGNDSTLMKSIWFALFKNCYYSYCSLICSNLTGYTLNLVKRCKEASKGQSCSQHSVKNAS